MEMRSKGGEWVAEIYSTKIIERVFNVSKGILIS
jgi:hypothetical protein